MRLCFELPRGWDEMVVALEAGPLVGLERFHPTAEIRHGGRVEIVAAQQGLETDTGWPMELVHAHRLDALGAVAEVRLAAVYLMGFYGGLAIARVAPILIVGDSGTGKTALARAIAEASGRQPIVRATLGASDDLNTTTSELFGHERGSFSGAVTRRLGLVELAHGGVLILDEILNLPRAAQQLLLDFTQFGTYRPLGFEGAQPRRSSARLIAATNGDLDAAVRDGRFRLDLYYRLAAVVLRLPPLRARRAEIPALAEGHLRRLDPARDWRLSWSVRRLLVTDTLTWPGNVRQLEALIARARYRALARDPEASELLPEHFDHAGDFGLTVPSVETPGERARAEAPTTADLAGRWRGLQGDRDRMEQQERELVVEALRRNANIIARAARELDVPRTTLVSRLRALGVQGDKV